MIAIPDKSLYLLTDGKTYLKETVQKGHYLPTPSAALATEFTYQQAKALIANPRPAVKWIGRYYMVNKEDGKSLKREGFASGNGGVYVGVNKPQFDESLMDTIDQEAKSILGLAAWDRSQLEKNRVVLTQALSYYDSAIGDVMHAIEGKNPPAHTRAKIWKILKDLREKHTKAKQQIAYIDTMKQAITQNWEISKLKTELNKAVYVPYKGRTDYYDAITKMM